MTNKQRWDGAAGGSYRKNKYIRLYLSDIKAQTSERWNGTKTATDKQEELWLRFESITCRLVSTRADHYATPPAIPNRLC